MEQGWARDTMGFQPQELASALSISSHNNKSMALPSPEVLVLAHCGTMCRVRPACELERLPVEKNNTKFSDTTICVATKPRNPRPREQRPFPTSLPRQRAQHRPPGLERS